MNKLFSVAIALFVISTSVFAQSDIRQVDFKNFTFELGCAGEKTQKVRVKDGEFSEEKKVDDYIDRFYFKVIRFFVIKRAENKML